MKRRKESCDHPWVAIRASITGLVCTQCGTTWPPDAANVAWIKALAAVNDLGKQIEQLQAALFQHLDMTSCDICGQFFPDKPLAIHGIKTKHFSLCRGCLLTGYYRSGINDPDAGAELLDAIARWYYLHRDHIPGRFPRLDVERLIRDRLVTLAQTDGARTRITKTET
jgi:Pyruvate/2-oxoacid:ferredoxin oxidoreductase delta subunit